MTLPPTPDGRYEGRPLADPTEPLADQGLQFDIGTLLSRRRIFGVLGVGAVGLTLAACSSSATASGSASATSSTGLVEIPDETNGPYPGDGTNGPDILEQSGVVRSDITASFGDSTTVAEGIPMTLTLTILDMANGGGAFAGVAVYVWQCNRDGNYSLYSSGLENENYLRGVQIADADGKVTFTSIYPACYEGRWPHAAIPQPAGPSRQARARSGVRTPGSPPAGNSARRSMARAATMAWSDRDPSPLARNLSHVAAHPTGRPRGHRRLRRPVLRGVRHGSTGHLSARAGQGGRRADPGTALAGV